MTELPRPLPSPARQFIVQDFAPDTTRLTSAEAVFPPIAGDGQFRPASFDQSPGEPLALADGDGVAPNDPSLYGYPPLISPGTAPQEACGPAVYGVPDRFTFRDDVRELVPMLGDDVFSVINWRNAILLGAAAGGAVALRVDADGDVREQTAHHPLRWGNGSRTLRYVGEAGVQMPVMLGVYGYSLWQQDAEWHDFSKALISAHAITSVSTVILKGVTDTQRPDPARYGGRWGFPSYHTSSSFAIAATIDEYYGWRAGLPAYALAGLVGWSRIDGREHDLSDVLFGAALGYVIGKSVACAHRERDSWFQIVPFYDTTQQASGVLLEAPF